MFRSLKVGALMGAAALAQPAWGQGMQPDNTIVIHDAGKATTCRVLKCWKQADGSRACQVQAIQSGEIMTIIDPVVPGTKTTVTEGATAKPAASRSVFRWGRTAKAPAGAPVVPANATVIQPAAPVAAAAATSPIVPTSGTEATPTKLPPAPASTTAAPVPAATAPAAPAVPATPNVTHLPPKPGATTPPAPTTTTTAVPATVAPAAGGCTTCAPAAPCTTCTTCDPCAATTKAASPGLMSRLFGKKSAAPKAADCGCATPCDTCGPTTTTTVVPCNTCGPTTTGPVKATTCDACGPAVGGKVVATVTHEDAKAAKPGIMARVFGSKPAKPTATTVVSGGCDTCGPTTTVNTTVTTPAVTATVKTETAPSADWRQSWGKADPLTPDEAARAHAAAAGAKTAPVVVSTDPGRPVRPLIDDKTVDPLTKPETFAALADRPAAKPKRGLFGWGTTPATPAVKGEVVIKETVVETKPTTVTLPVTVPAVTTPVSVPGTPVSAAPRMTTPRAPANLWTRIGGDARPIGAPPAVVAAPAPTDEPEAPADSLVTLFSRMSGPVRPTPAAARRMSMAQRQRMAGVDPDTVAGRYVMTPGGNVVFSNSPGSEHLPSIPVGSNNAFAGTGGAMVMAGVPEGAGNAFTAGGTSRPVPADFSAGQPQIPNAFVHGGVGSHPFAAAGRVPAYGYGMPAPGYGQGPAMAYGYPQAPVMPMVPQPAPVGFASTATHAPTGTPALLARLKAAELPSERETAVEQLARVNWRTEPAVIDTLVHVATNDPAPAVRACSLRVLGSLKANTLPVVEAAQKGKTDGDLRVRRQAEETLATLGAK